MDTQVESTMGRDHFGVLKVDGRTVLKRIVQKKAVKVKIKLSLCLTKHHVIKTY